MAEAQGCQAGRGVRLVTQPVLRLLGGCPVVAQAVGLDDEAQAWATTPCCLRASDQTLARDL